MAPVNGFRPVTGQPNDAVNGFHTHDPPPSTIASHLAPVSGLVEPQFDRRSFNLLLEEALGCDEDGRPNLGDDVETNVTLIRVIFQAGIEPILQESKDNPFASTSSGRNSLQLVQCFEVVRLAIEKCPRILYTPRQPGVVDADDSRDFFFEWLLPKVLIFLGASTKASDVGISKCGEIITATLLADVNCSSDQLNSGRVLAFLLAWIKGGFRAPQKKPVRG